MRSVGVLLLAGGHAAEGGSRVKGLVQAEQRHQQRRIETLSEGEGVGVQRFESFEEGPTFKKKCIFAASSPIEGHHLFRGAAGWAGTPPQHEIKVGALARGEQNKNYSALHTRMEFKSGPEPEAAEKRKHFTLNLSTEGTFRRLVDAFVSARLTRRSAKPRGIRNASARIANRARQTRSITAPLNQRREIPRCHACGGREGGSGLVLFVWVAPGSRASSTGDGDGLAWKRGPWDLARAPLIARGNNTDGGTEGRASSRAVCVLRVPLADSVLIAAGSIRWEGWVVG
ncbi:unnamed protein product [Lampetra fluviatilis]